MSARSSIISKNSWHAEPFGVRHREFLAAVPAAKNSKLKISCRSLKACNRIEILRKILCAEKFSIRSINGIAKSRTRIIAINHGRSKLDLSHGGPDPTAQEICHRSSKPTDALPPST
jgi:hypothetical protein